MKTLILFMLMATIVSLAYWQPLQPMARRIARKR